ncbi:alpha/beta hydrolase [Halomonas chromatireducens]|uniref:Alpha/beta hydrolase family protein n=1 Tax=Halomonas chromatireducens TaxID=507626 RepID=A0A109ULB5_9GAMM|nr:alpha/beta hydrolase [Halomonas chromatireducens]AMD00244.1 Alpha/beta hydrolase family protein [Halomonas chromatireducens]
MRQLFPSILPLQHRLPRLALLMVALLSSGGCVSNATLQSPGPGAEEPRITTHQVVADDGYRLPLRHWPAQGEAGSVALAVHGFNDHAGSFSVLADALTRQGVEVYAHDQRGFGTTEQRRLWAGHQRLSDDVALLADLMRERHPHTPIYLIGKSMGAAIVILTMTGDDPPPVDGSVLIAPAVWGREAMPWYQRLGLWLGVRLIPQVSFSVHTTRSLGIEPTDDEAIKRQLAQDPLILRSARVDTLHGVTDTMDRALHAAPDLPGPTLVLYGDEDQVIPAEAFCALLNRLPETEPATGTGWRLALYPDGYHMLTRYTQRARTEQDIVAWLTNPAAPLPSGHETSRDQAREALCQ